MKNASECQNMEEIRTNIDHIDEQIVDFIAQRADYVKAAARFKTDEKAVRDEERVQKVIDSKVQMAINKGVSPDLIRKLYQLMIEHFIETELSDWQSGMSDPKKSPKP